jgi:hypothetical protein
MYLFVTVMLNISSLWVVHEFYVTFEAPNHKLKLSFNDSVSYYDYVVSMVDE